MRGLPEEVRRELFYRSSLDFDDDERPIDLSTLIEQAERIASSEQKLQNFSKRPEERGKFDNLIEQLRAKPDASEGRVLQAPIAPPLVTESEPKDISLSMDNLTNQLSAMMLALSHLNASNNNNVMPQRQNSVPRYPGGFGIARRPSSENMASRSKCWWDHGDNHMLFRCYDMANWIQAGRVHWSQDGKVLYLGREGQDNPVAVPLKHPDQQCYRDSVLEAEAEQKAKKETGQVRSLSVCVGGARIFSDSSDEEWDDEMETFHHDKISIAAARIESNKERRSNPLGTERISIVKKKVEFEKDLAVPKAARFGDFLSRIPQGDRIDNTNMSDVDKRQATPKTSSSKPIAKPVVENQPSVQKPKPSSPVKEKLKDSENERYIIPVKKVKDNFKTAADTEKMLKLLFKQPVQGILVKDLLANQYVTVISEDSTNFAKFYTGPAEKRIGERISAVRSLS